MTDDAAPHVRCVDDATILPLRRDTTARLPFRIGGFDRDGAIIPEMRLLRFDRHAADPEPPAERPACIPGEHVYGGIRLGHYGHFLLESLARLWALRAAPALPIVWHTNGRPAPWQEDLFRLAGLDPARFIIVDRPMRFERLHVPQAGFVIGRACHPLQGAAFGLVAVPPGRPGGRLWLSRSRLTPPVKRVAGEAEVEAGLAARGWRILHPETLSAGEQLAALAGADVVAGVEGSAFHTMVLLRGFGGRVVMVPRHHRGVAINVNHRLIFTVREVPLKLIEGLLEPAPPEPGGPPLAFRDTGAAAGAIDAA